MAVRHTPRSTPTINPLTNAWPSRSMCSFILLIPYASLHTLYTTLSRDCQHLFTLFFVNNYRDLGRLLWLATVGHVEKCLDSGIDSGYPDISAWFELESPIGRRL